MTFRQKQLLEKLVRREVKNSIREASSNSMQKAYSKVTNAFLEVSDTMSLEDSKELAKRLSDFFKKESNK